MPTQDPNITENNEENDVPTSSAAKTTTARRKQSEASKRATFEMLKSKKRRELEITFNLDENTQVTMLLVAIGAQEYDRLVSKHPPTTEQRVDGNSYNINTFAPALMSAVIQEPDMTAKEWEEIWNSPDWNRGEVIDLFSAVASLCVQGLDIPLS
jgi:hypothetical protein